MQFLESVAVMVALAVARADSKATFHSVVMRGRVMGLLEMAGRVADFLELGELMCLDALEREESCGAHFREEHQTEDGEALRNDAQYAHVAAWEYAGDGQKPIRNVEQLEFEYVPLQTRSYK